MAEKISTSVSNPASDAEKTVFDREAAAQRAESRLELRAARRAGMRWRRISRWLGLGFFVFGAALLFYVFWQALGGLQSFADPGRLNQQFARITGNSTQLSVVISAVVSVFGSALLRVLYLLILGFLASAIAARGIQFFAASEAVIDEAVLPED